ncbi:ABC transporter permease subunit [Ectothiorhodospiraceae bacterium BW-2]|nr:ABC transporter permease subunit [Ectothiorhodospiraceae bacterium BW-2]
MIQLVADSRQKWRTQKDKLARLGITLGGVGVIAAIVTIFFYLAWVVLPMFESPDSTKVATYALENSGQVEFMLVDEQSEYAIVANNRAEIIYFDVRTGVEIKRYDFSSYGNMTTLAVDNYEDGVLALGYDDGSALVVRAGFRVTYPDRRVVKPLVEFPYGEKPLQVSDSTLRRLAMRNSDEKLTLAALSGSRGIELIQIQKEVSFLDEDDVTLTRSSSVIDTELTPEFIMLDPEQRHLFLADREGNYQQFLVTNVEAISKIEERRLLESGEINSIKFLIGGVSLLFGDATGVLSQWFNVRDEQGALTLKRIRDLGEASSTGGEVTTIATELRRKGVLTGDSLGNVTIYHTTAERELLKVPVSDDPIVALASSPRSDSFLALDSGNQFHFYEVHNEHPEVSVNSLWSSVHYEGYPQEEFIWQSSAANNDFEPKYSLVPLAFGTLKAAFYAMLVAVPLAILGAIYTAYFMTPKMRQMVKPTIEIMEALPTVIIGFLAGLWLAPSIEVNLPGMFAMLLIVPLSIFAASYGWWRLPKDIKSRVPDGWEAAMLVPVVFIAIWLSLAISPLLESLFFGGDMRGWLGEIGVDFDQRNSIIIGLAMGFAVIPTIFSITEDAVFSVPKHLTFGSLALGATPWQTLSRVVILTASPGIFSAVMIGLGRAVGETMIVLMATGNTPIMDFNIFEGMRTLAANIAVEMPESEVDSTHYRILFLTALVLLIFTFFFNTLAEIVRHRLRKKYSSM